MSETVKTVEELGENSRKLCSQIVQLREGLLVEIDKTHRNMYQLIAKLNVTMHEEGKWISQTAIKKLSGLSQGYISKVFKAMENYARQELEVAQYNVEARRKARDALIDWDLGVTAFIEKFTGYEPAKTKTAAETKDEKAEAAAEAASEAGEEVSKENMAHVVEMMLNKMKTVFDQVCKHALSIDVDQASKLLEQATKMTQAIQALPALKAAAGTVEDVIAHEAKGEESAKHQQAH